MGVSNIAVQVYEKAFGSHFREIPHKQALPVKHFDFIPPHAFLCSLRHALGTTEKHGFWKPAGKCLGLSRVGVRVGHLNPCENPYPIWKMAG